MSEKEIQERIDGLIRQLGTDNYREAINDLSKIEDSAVPALIRALGDESSMVRSGSARALGRITEKCPEYHWSIAIPGLIERLGDEDLDVRSWASWALVKMIENGADVKLKDVRAALLESVMLLGDKYPGINNDAAQKYIWISNAVKKRKRRLNGSTLSEGTVKAPAGNKEGMFRSGNRAQFA